MQNLQNHTDIIYTNYQGKPVCMHPWKKMRYKLKFFGVYLATKIPKFQMQRTKYELHCLFVYLLIVFVK